MNTIKITEILERYKEEKSFSGVALIRSDNNTALEFACGYANRMHKIKNAITTPFDTASITKLFTAAAIILLEHRGFLHIDDYVHDIINLQGTKIPEDVTIKHLLTHTSGIADDAEEEKGEEYSDLFVDSPNYAIRENKDFIKNFAYKKPNFKPGEKIYYNNCAFVLLGLVIEKITGMNYRDFVEKEIFELFEMKNTFFAAKEDTDRIVAEGYYFDGEKLKKNIYLFPPIGTADSGAYTTAEDLDIFMRKIYKSPIFSKMMKRQTILNRDAADNGTVPTMGFGFEIEVQNGESYCISKEGANFGVCNVTAFYPQKNITVTILGNVDCNIWEMHNEIKSLL